MDLAKSVRHLTEIVGPDNVERASLALTARSADHSLYGPGLVDCIIHAETAKQVQGVVKFANDTGTALTPSSSGIHFNGNALPRKQGLVLDLSRMSKIKEIDEMHHVAHVEPGVTWEQFQTALELKGYRSIIPFFPHASRSVVTDWLEREQPTVHVTEYAEPMMSMQVIWGNGEKFVTGSASINHFRQPGCLADGTNPMGPGTVSFWRFLQGAQGTMGVVTWCIVKVEEIPVMSKPFFLPFSHIEDAIDPLYLYTRRRLGYECLLVNNVDLGLVLAGSGWGEFAQLRKELPAWTMIIVLGALKRRPEEKLAYEEEALREICAQSFPGTPILTSLPMVPDLESKLPGMLRKPWPRDIPYWKHSWRGGCVDLTFMTTMDRAPYFVKPIEDTAVSFGYAAADIGSYLQPVENGRACQLRFSFYYNPTDSKLAADMRGLHAAAAAVAIKHGAVFNRPYGPIADLVYESNPDYVATLRRLKNLFDPKGILNPGHLCFT